MIIKLYGLLYLASQENSSVNLPVKNFQDQIGIYLKNAINLSTSLRSKDIDFTLLTNQKETLDKLSLQYGFGSNLKTKEIRFETTVPHGIRFYSAHYKLDVVKYLASLNEPYVGMCDLDILAINNVPECLKNIMQDKIPLYYDISDQVISEYGHEKIIRDMKKLSPFIREGRWAGGEFLAGPPAFFSALNNEVQDIYINYLKVYAEVHHQGDEMPMSVALEIMRRNGQYIADAGTLGIIGRYWSVSTKFKQKPFGYFKGCFLLHLPADKIFLAKLSCEEANNKDKFLRKYIPFQTVRRLLSRCKKKLKLLFCRKTIMS